MLVWVKGGKRARGMEGKGRTDLAHRRLASSLSLCYHAGGDSKACGAVNATCLRSQINLTSLRRHAWELEKEEERRALFTTISRKEKIITFHT
jgi:hypothetical protein